LTFILVATTVISKLYYKVAIDAIFSSRPYPEGAALLGAAVIAHAASSRWREDGIEEA